MYVHIQLLVIIGIILGLFQSWNHIYFDYACSYGKFCWYHAFTYNHCPETWIRNFIIEWVMDDKFPPFRE